MKELDWDWYIEMVPETSDDHAWLEKKFPQLIPFRTVCIAKENRRLVKNGQFFIFDTRQY